VLAEVDDRVRAPRRVDPAVAGEVVVGRRQLRVVVDADRILAVAARGWIATTTLPSSKPAMTKSLPSM